MTRLVALTRFELRLWLRSTGFWLAVLAIHAFAFGTSSFGRLLTSRWLSEQILGSGLLFGSLLILFASAAIVARDRTDGTEELFDAMPVTNAHVLFSRWLSGMLLWLLLGLEIFVVAGALIALQDGAVLEVWPLVSLYVLHFVPAILFIHTLGMAIGVFVRQPFILYSVLTVTWGATAYIAREIALESFWNLDSLTLFHLTGIGSPVRRISDLVGIFPFEPYIFWQRIFFGGLTVLLIAVAALKFRAQRESGDARRPRRRAWSLAGAVIGGPLILIGAIQYIPQYSAMPVRSAEPIGWLLDRSVMAETYDLYVQIDDPGWYSVTANIGVRNASDKALSEISPLLTSDCRIADVSSLVNEDNILTFTLPAPLAPGEAAEINVSYRCPVHPLVQRFSPLGAHIHVMDNLIYPIFSDNQRLTHFSLSVEAPEDFLLMTSVPKMTQEDIGNGRLRTYFEGTALRLDVFGGPLAYDVIDGVETYYYPAHVGAIGNYIGELADRMAFYETWLGEAEYVPGVTPRPIVVENIIVSSSDNRPPFKEGFLSASEWYVPQFYREDNAADRFLLASQASSLWWGPSPFSYTGSLTAVEAAANRYLSALYVAHRDGEEWYDEAVAIIEDDLAAYQRGSFASHINGEAARRVGLFSRGDRVGAAVFMALHEVRSTLGNDALQSVLQALQQRHIDLARLAVDSSNVASPPPRVANPSSEHPLGPNVSSNFWRDDTDNESPTEASLRFLFDTIAAFPGGEDVVERSDIYRKRQ